MSCSVEPSATPKRRGAWPLVLRAAAGLGILAVMVATLRIDARALTHALAKVHPAALALPLLGYLVLMAAKSWRWVILLRAAGLNYSFRSAYRSYLAAFALGIVTPGRLGELARAAQVQRELGARLAPCVRSVVGDRLFDLLFLAAFGPLAFWTVMGGRIGGGYLLAATLGLFAVVCVLAGRMGRLLSRWEPRGQLLQTLVRGVAEVSGDLTGAAGFKSMGITAASYGIFFGASWLLLQALGEHLSFRQVACVTGCLSLVLLLPISIASIGPREATLVFLLGQMGVTQEHALAYSILQFAVFTLFGGFVGIVALVLGPANQDLLKHGPQTGEICPQETKL